MEKVFIIKEMKMKYIILKNIFIIIKKNNIFYIILYIIIITNLKK
jgi:hypothetical protein